MSPAMTDDIERVALRDIIDRFDKAALNPTRKEVQ